MRFLHLSVFFEMNIIEWSTNVSSSKMHWNAENTCLYGIWQLGFSLKMKTLTNKLAYYYYYFVIALSVKPELDCKLNCFCFKLSNQPLPRPTHISRHNITRVTSSMKCRHRNVAARHLSLTSVSTSRRCPTTKTWTPSPASLSTMQVILPGEKFLGIHKWRHS